MTQTQVDIGIYEATHRGYLNIAGIEIPCAVLSNGKRIISQTGIFEAFDRPRKGEKRREGLPSIIGAKNLMPYVNEEIRAKCHAIHYFHTNGRTAVGYDAELIPLVCELYLDADEDNPRMLVASQEKIVQRAKVIIRALAKVGITALIDEATGYQYDREKDELQRLLSKYIAEDYLKWQSRFPRKFYQEVFRLYGWEYDPLSLKRPSCLGHFTNEYVYDLMPPGVLEELRKKNPITKKGFRKRKHHQHLTEDIGIPHLDRHLTKLITVMELSNGIEDFKDKFYKVFKNKNQLKLDIET